MTLNSPIDLIKYEAVGAPFAKSNVLLIWGHGWGQDRRSLSLLAAGLPRCTHILIDFPGFGQSPLPSETWGTIAYADACAGLIDRYRQNARKVVWVGHSFGGRVGIQLAARHPSQIDGLCLIAAAGLPRRRGFYQSIRMKVRVLAYKSVKRLSRLLKRDLEPLKTKFGSADYRNAGPLREIFVKVINEDLAEAARRIDTPCLLIYGARDSETPPDIGRRLSKLINRSELCVLANQDHYSVLDSGRHQVIKRISEFCGKL